MNINQIFEEIKIDTQNYLTEAFDIEKKGGKFYIKFDGSKFEQSKEYYLSLESAISDLLSFVYKNKYKKMSFEKKQEKIRKWAEDWKERQIKADKRKKIFGFEELK